MFVPLLQDEIDLYNIEERQPRRQSGDRVAQFLL